MRVQDIITKAFDKVGAKLDGVIMAITVSRTGGTKTYDPATGAYTGGTPMITTGRGLFEDITISTLSRNPFPGYVFTGTEKMMFLSELDWAPKEGDSVSINGKPDMVVKACLDLLQTEEGFRVIVN